MAIQGLRTSENLATGDRPKNFREILYTLYPRGSGNYPLFALTNAMKTRSVDDPEFYWFEKAMAQRRVTLGASLTTTNTTLTLTVADNEQGAKQFTAGNLLYVEQTGEVLRVAQDPTSHTALVVERGQAGTTAAAVTYNGAGVNPNLVGIGSAFEEGSLAPSGVARDMTQVYNYTQIMRQTYEATRTAQKTRVRTKETLAQAKFEAMELLSTDLERAFFLGKRSLTYIDGKPIRTMNGFESYVSSDNVFTADASGGTSMEALEEYCYKLFKYGSNEKLWWVGNRALLTIQQIIRKNSSFNIQSGLKEYGMNVSRLVTPFGEIVLKNHPLFNIMPGGTTGGSAYYGRDSWVMSMDMANLQYVYLKDSDIKPDADLTPKGMDGAKGGYIGEVSLEVHHPLTHGIIKNLAKAKAD